MSVGDYVRTKRGIIGKIKLIDNQTELEDLYLVKRQWYYKEDITKSNSNIIELLEPMDLLYIDISPDDCGGIVVPRIPETLDELEKYIEKIKSGEYILKYVVTHEQLENNMYKVGE